MAAKKVFGEEGLGTKARLKVLLGEVHFWVVSLAEMDAPGNMSAAKIPARNEDRRRHVNGVFIILVDFKKMKYLVVDEAFD